MYLFSQQLQVRGDPRKTVPWAMALAALVNRKTALQGSLWVGQAGVPVGSLAFTAFVQSRTEIGAADEQLRNDDEYLDLVMEGQPHVVSAPENSLLEIVHTAGNEYRRAEVGSVVAIISAEVRPGNYMAAGQWSIEMADLVTEITGFSTLFARNVAGSFGGVEWIQAAPDSGAMEAAEESINKDGRYLAKLDQISGLFVEGSGRRVLARRIA